LLKDIENNAAIIGNRVKSTRMLAGYTRTAFSQISGISMATLRTWEDPTHGRRGITKKGAKRFINVVNNLGIYCTEEWLLLGKGPGSTIMDVIKNVSLDNNSTVTWGEEEAIFKDIESFKTNNPDPIVASIVDDSMLPFYSYGDYIGGSRKTGDNIAALIGLNCIIELQDKIVVRKISIIDNENKYVLTALNIKPSTVDAVIVRTDLVAASEIVWHRSRGKNQE